jgi:hypothetical protein
MIFVAFHTFLATSTIRAPPVGTPMHRQSLHAPLVELEFLKIDVEEHGSHVSCTPKTLSANQRTHDADCSTHLPCQCKSPGAKPLRPVPACYLPLTSKVSPAVLRRLQILKNGMKLCIVPPLVHSSYGREQSNFKQVTAISDLYLVYSRR